MVGNVDPVAHVAAVAVDRQGTALERLRNHQRDEFFRKLEWAVVVCTTGDDRRESVRLHRGKNQQVGGGLAGCIRTRRRER